MGPRGRGSGRGRGLGRPGSGEGGWAGPLRLLTGSPLVPGDCLVLVVAADLRALRGSLGWGQGRSHDNPVAPSSPTPPTFSLDSQEAGAQETGDPPICTEKRNYRVLSLRIKRESG